MNTSNHEPKPEDGQNIFLDPFAEPEETDLGHVPEQPEEATSQLPPLPDQPLPDQIEKPDEDTSKPESAPEPEDSVSVFSKIEERKAYLAQNPNKKGKLTKKIAVGATALLGLTGAALGIGLNASSEPEEGGVPQAQEPPNQEVNQSETQTGAEQLSNVEPEEEEKKGVIYGTGNIKTSRIIEGEPMVLPLWHGENVEVPLLRKDQNLETEIGRQLYMESALALLSCYTTTGDVVCLSELSRDIEVKRDAQANRDVFLDFAQAHTHSGELEPGDAGDWQVVIYDDPNNPARYTAHENIQGVWQIELTGGNVFYGFTNSSIWQDAEAQDPGQHEMLTLPVNTLRVDLDKDKSITKLVFNAE